MRRQVKINDKTRNLYFDNSQFSFGPNGVVQVNTSTSKTITTNTTTGGIEVAPGSGDGIIPGSNGTLKLISTNSGASAKLQRLVSGVWTDSGTEWS